LFWSQGRSAQSTPVGARIVEGQIIKIEFDCSSWIGDVPLDQWTRGPILPVGGEPIPAKNDKRRAKKPKKRP
jgi:hypothetical protein